MQVSADRGGTIFHRDLDQLIGLEVIEQINRQMWLRRDYSVDGHCSVPRRAMFRIFVIRSSLWKYGVWDSVGIAIKRSKILRDVKFAGQ